MSSSGDSFGNTKAAFEELWKQLGDCHQNAVQELEAKVSKLKKDRCLDAERIAGVYNRLQQLKTENKTLQGTISHLEERLQAGERCERCAVLEENLKSQGQNEQLISKLKSDTSRLEDENRQLQAELQKLKASHSELKEGSSPEQEEGVIPDSPILSSSLPAANRLKKLKHVDKLNHVRYVERPLPLSEKSIFFEPNGATKSSGRAEVLVPNTCELDASHILGDVDNMEEAILETCGLELLDKHQKTESDWNQQSCFKTPWKHDVHLKPFPLLTAPVPSPDSSTQRSPSLLPCVTRFSGESSISRMKRKKEESDEEVEGGNKGGIQEGMDEWKKCKRMQPEGITQSINRELLNSKVQSGTSNQNQNGSVFKMPRSMIKEDVKKRASQHLRASQSQHEDAARNQAAEHMWSIDPALTLSAYEQGGDEEKEEAQDLGNLADTDCTWISHSMLQGRGEDTQDKGDTESRLAEKANDSLDMMFDRTAYGEYKSFSSFSQIEPCDDDDDDDDDDHQNKEEKEKKKDFEQDPPKNHTRQGSRQPTFAHVAVVRKKDERRKLKGTTCKECEIYYAHLPEEEKQKKLSECSRHRFLYIPPCTPENFWEVGFPSTQTCIDRGYIKEEKSPQSRLRRRQPLNALFTPKKKREQT